MEFNFVNDDLRFINKDGDLVDMDGRLVNEDGRYIAYRTEEGKDKKDPKEVYFVNREGEEVVAITEYPTALLGTFDEEFLELPEEVIVTSMKEHQRYFAVYKDGKLTNNFIVVSNSNTDDLILWNKAIFGSKILSKESKQEMFESQKLKDGTATNYGFGWEINNVSESTSLFNLIISKFSTSYSIFI